MNTILRCLPKPVHLKHLRSVLLDLCILRLHSVLHAQPTTLTVSSEQHTSRSCSLLSPVTCSPSVPNPQHLNPCSSSPTTHVARSPAPVCQKHAVTIDMIIIGPYFICPLSTATSCLPSVVLTWPQQSTSDSVADVNRQFSATKRHSAGSDNQRPPEAEMTLQEHNIGQREERDPWR